MLSRTCPWCHRRWRDGRCGCLPTAPSGAVVRRRIPGLDAVLARHRYGPVVQSFVVAGKNRGRRDLLALLGRQLAQLAADHHRLYPDAVISWVPASASGRRRRGYDHGRLLARVVGRSTGHRVRPLLGRTGGSGQAGLGRRDRLRGPQVWCRVGRAPERVVLIDDVVTTGASLAAAAAALRAAGSIEVIGLCVASADDGPTGRGAGGGQSAFVVEPASSERVSRVLR